MKSKKYFLIPLTLANITFLPLLLTNCKKTNAINQALKTTKIDVTNKEQKLASEIKIVNDLNIENLDKFKYSIVNFKIVYPNQTTIRISFALKDKISKKISAIKTVEINNFKNPISIHELLQNISITLKDSNYTKTDIELLKENAFLISNYDSANYSLIFEKHEYQNDQLLTLTLSLMEKNNLTNKSTREYTFNLKNEEKPINNLPIDSSPIDPSPINPTPTLTSSNFSPIDENSVHSIPISIPKLLNTELENLASNIKLTLVNETEPIDNIVSKWQNKDFFNFSNVNSKVRCLIKNVIKIDNSKIKVDYVAWDANYPNNESSLKTHFFDIDNSKQKEYENKIKELYPKNIDANDKEYDGNNSFGKLNWDDASNDDEANSNSIFYKPKGRLRRKYKRTSTIGNKEEEVNELEDIFNKLYSTNEYRGIDLRSQYFDARNMAEALLKWYWDYWLDHVYVETDRQDPVFWHEASWNKEDYDDNPKNFEDQFNKLYFMEKRKVSWQNVDWKLDKILFDQKIKQQLIDFISLGLSQIDYEMSDVDKVYAAMRFIADYLAYNFDRLWNDFSDAIDTKEGVCHQYGFLTALLLRAANVEAFPISTYKNSHKITGIKLKTKIDNVKKWYFTDTTFMDVRSYSNPSGKQPGQINNGNWDYRQILIKEEKDKTKKTDRGEVQYLGSILNNYLPWDALNSENYAASQSFYERSIFSTQEIDNGNIKLVHFNHTNAPTRYFFYKGHWYTVSQYDDKNVPGAHNKGLFRFDLESNKMDLIKKGSTIIDNNDDIAKMLDLDNNYEWQLTFKEGKFLYYYYYNSVDKEHKIQVYDLINKQKMAEKNITSSFTNTHEIPKPDFSVSNENIKFTYKNIDKALNEFSFTLKDLIAENYLNLKQKTKNDLLKALQTTRIFYGTFMFSDSPDVNYLPLQLRNDFDKLKKDTEDMLKNSSLSEQQINNQIMKINDAKEKLLTSLKTKLSSRGIYFTNNVNKYNLVSNNALENHYKMPFAANSTYYLENFFQDERLFYDVYFSQTKPSDSDLLDSKYLRKNGLNYSQLVYSKEFLPQSGYLWIRAYFDNNPDKYKLSNIGYFEINENQRINITTLNSNSSNSNISKNKNESNFYYPTQLKTLISIENYQKFKELRLTFWRHYNGFSTKIKEETIANLNSNKYSLNNVIKSANDEPGRYFYTCTLVDNDNQLKELGVLDYYLNISENDASDFKLNKYFA